MATCMDQINETKRYLYAGHREQMNRLNGALNSTVETVTLENPLNAIQPASYLSVDLEIMYVWSVDSPTRTASVARGQLGSVAATHATLAPVTVNPKFPDFSIMQALNMALDEMSGRGLFQAITKSFTYVAGKQGYDLTGATAVLDKLDARFDPAGRRRDWPMLHNWHIRRNSDPTDFPSGFSVILEDTPSVGRQVRVSYSAPFNHYTTLATTTASVGLLDVMADIPPLGAAVRMQQVREGQRNFNEAQPETRRSEEVPVGAQLTSARGLKDAFDSRITTELRRLNKLYPHRKRVA